MAANQALQAVMSRRSVRSYTPEQIKTEELKAIIEAGQAAPYAWEDCRHFTVVQGREKISRLNASAKKAAAAFSEEMKALFDESYDGTYGAPTLIVVSGNASVLQYEAVCGASIENMLIAAKALDLGSCWIYFAVFAFMGADAEYWKAELRIPEGYKPVAAVLLGYEGEGEAQNAEQRYTNAVTYIGEDG